MFNQQSVDSKIKNQKAFEEANKYNQMISDFNIRTPNIFVETFLCMSGIKTEPMCSMVGMQSTNRLSFTIIGITDDEARKFAGYFREKGDQTVYYEERSYMCIPEDMDDEPVVMSEEQQRDQTQRISVDGAFFHDNLLPDFLACINNRASIVR